MRSTLLLALAIASGCAAPCAGPEQISGVPYEIFATIGTLGPTSNEEAFPSYTTPANGPAVWRFDWGATDTGPITVVIDDQELEATGSWSTIECGNFTVDFDEQPYVAPDDPTGTIHRIRFSGIFSAYDDRLEGSGSFAETWTTPADGEQPAADGVLNVPELQLRGILTTAP